MKVAINQCYGGFRLSSKAVARLAELQGRPCYFFKQPEEKYVPITLQECSQTSFWIAFDIPNPNDELIISQQKWALLSNAEKLKLNRKFESHHLNSRYNLRSDPLLIQTIEELGNEANGPCAKIEIVEVPDDIKWKINEYDGKECVVKKRSGKKNLDLKIDNNSILRTRQGR